MANQLCSIIVAAYNEENNINQCLEYLIKQTYNNTEIIVVDDGSTDSTSACILEYVKKFKNIKYIFQENKGAASARKKGVLEAKGDFITFIDCDDEILISSIEIAMNEFDDEIDIVLFKLHTSACEYNKEYSEFKCFTENKVITGTEAFGACLNSWGLHGLGVYKKTIFMKANNRYDFFNFNNENYVNNDEIVTKLSFLFSKKIKRSDAVYLYKYNPNSTTNRINQRYCLILENTLLLKKICEDIEFDFKFCDRVFNETKYVYKRFLKWYPNLSNRLLWLTVLKKSLKFLLNDFHNDLGLKNRVKLYRMYIHLCVIGWYEK